MIVFSAVQSSAPTLIHNNVLFIDTSDNAWYNQVQCLIWTPYLAIIANNDRRVWEEPVVKFCAKYDHQKRHKEIEMKLLAVSILIIVLFIKAV